jgi:hypothetical protein
MKRAIVTLLAAALLGTLLPGLPLLAQSLKVRHENPATARETDVEYNLLLTYSDVIDLVADGQYGSAADRLQELRQASLPADITGIIDQYSDIYGQMLTALDDLDGRMDDISALLAANRTGEAGGQLEAAEAAITEAGYLLTDLAAATAGLDEKVGALSGLLPDDPLARAYDRLQQDMGRLDETVAEFDTARQDLSERYTRLAGLALVEISLETGADSAFVGDTVAASGRLVSGGRPLAGRMVAVTSDNVTLATAVTAPNGSYELDVTMPYSYINSISFTAVYAPSEDDIAVYLGALSQPVAIAVTYYPCRLEISLPDTVYPGQAFTLSGEVTPTDSPAGREIIIALDGRPLAKTAVTGRFSLEISPPPGTPAGRQEIAVAVPPQGRYAGASRTSHVTVAIASTRLQADMPTVVFVPRTMHVRGEVYNGPVPVGGAAIDISLSGWHTAAMTAADGSFQADVPLQGLPPAAPLTGNPLYVSVGSTALPFNLSPLGWQDLEITARSPGLSTGSFEMRQRVVSVNPLTAVLLAAVGAAAWALANRRLRRSVPTPAEFPTLDEAAPPPPTRLPPSVPVLTGVRGRVLAAYRSGLTAVQKLTGAGMGPDTTLREFLGVASLPSPAARDGFTELTGIAEDALYARSNPRTGTAARAEKLALGIEEELDRGAA